MEDNLFTFMCVQEYKVSFFGIVLTDPKQLKTGSDGLQGNGRSMNSESSSSSSMQLSGNVVSCKYEKET